MPHSHAATVRSVCDRVVRAQRAYAVRLREARDALHPLLEEGDARALDLAHAIRQSIRAGRPDTGYWVLATGCCGILRDVLAA